MRSVGHDDGDDAPVSLLAMVAAITGALLVTIAWTVAHRIDADPVVSLSAASPSDDGGWHTGGRSWERDVVRIRNDRCTDTIRGTGVVVDGAVLTNRHVVEGARALVVTTADGVDHRVEAVAGSQRIDFAVLRVGGLGPGRSLARRADHHPLTIAGFPGGGPLVTSEVGVDGSLDGLQYPHPPSAIRLDVNVVGGESGSPIVDRDGRVVALVYARETAGGRGLAIPAADLAVERGRVGALAATAC